MGGRDGPDKSRFGGFLVILSEYCCKSEDNARAVRLLELSAHMRRAPARAWFNLGIAYHRLGNYEAALAAYQHAAAMPDSTKDMQQAAQNLADYERFRKATLELRSR